MYGRKKGYTRPYRARKYSKSSWKSKGVSRGYTRYAKRRPFNDDPQTPFCAYPLSSNRNEFYCKITGQVAVISGVTNTPWACSGFFHFPGYYVATAGTAGLMPVIPNNLDNLVALYDEYCVMGLQTRYVPEITVNPPGNPIGTGAPKNIIYTNRDLVDPTIIANEDAANNGAGMKIQQAMSGWTRYDKPQNRQWLPSLVTPILGSSTFNQLSQSFQPSPLETVKVFVPICLAVGIGYIHFTWYVRWRGLSPETT